MKNDLSKKELKKKLKFHKKKAMQYEKQIKKFDKNTRRIGFIHYD